MDSPLNEREWYEPSVSPEKLNFIRHETTAELGEAALRSTQEESTIDQAIETVDRSQEVFRVYHNPKTREVETSSEVKLAQYERETHPDDWKSLMYWNNELHQTIANPKGARTNATPAGGGVAMMVPTHKNMFEKLGVDMPWLVPLPFKDKKAKSPYPVTKNFHNTMQRQIPPDRFVSGEEEQIHHAWINEDAEVMLEHPGMRNADFLIVDDQQMVPLIPLFKKINPDAKIIWRNHIDNDRDLIADETTPQGYLWNYHKKSGLDLVDAYVFHPDVRDKFVPYDIEDKTFLMPATIDQFDDMNRPLSSEEVQEKIASVNQQIIEKNSELEDEDQMETIDPNQNRILMMARFDESKGGEKAMAMAMMAKQLVAEKLRERGEPEDSRPMQFIYAGNGSIDDPSGIAEFERMIAERRRFAPEDRRDIVLTRFKHDYAARNALMYKSESDAALVGVQTSDAEGCETVISDQMEHGTPMVVANRGGMPLQVIPGESGIVLDYDREDFDLERGAEFIAEMILDKEKHAEARESTKAAYERHNARNYTTVANATRWLRVITKTLRGEPADKKWRMQDLAQEIDEENAAA